MATVKLTKSTTGGQDAYVSAKSATTQAKNYGSETKLYARNKSGENLYSFLNASFPKYLRGAKIVSATLKLKLAENAPGANSLRVRVVTEGWKYNRVTWGNQPAAAGAYVDHSIGNGASGWRSIDITDIIEDVAAGSLTWRGLRLSMVSQDSNRFDFHSMDAKKSSNRPYIEVVYSRAPDKVTSASPSASRAVATLTPKLTWKYRDPDGDKQTAYQVIVTNDADATIHDSGKLYGSTKTYQVPEAVLSWDTYYKFKVRVYDAYDVVSPYSGLFRFRTLARPSIEITAPIVTTASIAPRIAWTYTHPSTQAWYRVILQVFDEDAWRTVYDTQTVGSSDAAHVIPRGYVNEEVTPYKVIVRVADATEREVIPDEPPYSEASAEFLLIGDPEVSPVSALTVSQATPKQPGAKLEWTRSTTPDLFIVWRKRTAVAAVDAPSWEFVAEVDGTEREYVDNTCPSTEVSYRVWSVVEDSPSNNNPERKITLRFVPYWLVCPAHPEYDCPIPAWRDYDPDMQLDEDSELFAPKGRRDKVQVTNSLRGFDGTLSTVFHDGAMPIKAQDAYLRIQRLKATTEPVYLLTRWQSWRVEIMALGLTPMSSMPGAYDVSLSFVQTGGYDVPG